MTVYSSEVAMAAAAAGFVSFLIVVVTRNVFRMTCNSLLQLVHLIVLSS